MAESDHLTREERQWLLAVKHGPLVKLSAERRVPGPVLRSLLDKRLVRWKNGFADVSLLVVTERGALESDRHGQQT